MGIHRVTGQFYIGSRTTKKLKLPPEQDLVKYRTSSKVVKPIFDEFDWHIVAIFFDAYDAFKFEQEFIQSKWSNKLLLNQAVTNIDKVFVYRDINRFGVNNSMYGKKHTMEARRKQSEIAKGNRSHNRNSKWWTDGSICKFQKECPGDGWYLGVITRASDINSNNWKITSPEGEVIFQRNLSKFCKTYGLSYGCMLHVNKGTMENHKGWICTKVE
jgi:hypothetical protein